VVVVGISASRELACWDSWECQADVLPARYVDSVLGAGALPLLLPAIGPAAVELLDRVDALVLSGGADVDPARYGAPPHPLLGPTQETRDATELALAAEAVRRGLPLLAVCRGLQVLNVALGGDLVQDLSELPGCSAHVLSPGVYTPTGIRLEPDSWLAGALGPAPAGQCHHHQALGRLGAGLVAVGWAPDGVVEAAELRARALTVGVQWHPEQDEQPRLFRAFVEAVSRGVPSPA
jgi:putative glutamine amidotransferase